MKKGGVGRWFAVVLAAGALAAVGLSFHHWRAPLAVIPAPKPPPASRPSTLPDETPQTPPVRTYLDVVRKRYPAFRSVRPLAMNVELPEAGHLLLNDPVYVCPRGDMWVTRPDAAATAEILRTAVDDVEHVVPERVEFVHWGQVYPTLVVDRVGGGWDFVNIEGRASLPSRRAYRWDRAISWGERIVVPTDVGVSIITPGRRIKEDYHELLVVLATKPLTTTSSNEVFPATGISFDARAHSGDIQVTFDGRGFLAWAPPDDGPRIDGRRIDGAVSIDDARQGHVARYVDGAWTSLTGVGWASRPVHLMPLLDGSVIQVVRQQNGSARLEPVTLESAAVNPTAIEALVEQLGDDDPDKRTAAYAELARYGQGIWPQLENHAQDASPEVSSRVQSLLQAKLEPTLGGFPLVDRKLKLVNRFPDGGALFYADAGAIVPFGGAGEEPKVVAPAWLSCDPGQPVELLSPAKVNGLNPDACRLMKFHGTWILTDADGPRRFQEPTRYVPLLRKSERAFTRVVAIDRRGRWLFRQDDPLDITDQPRDVREHPRDDTLQPLDVSRQTLILDPALPDPTPRLAVWLLDFGGRVGWDRADWPVVVRNRKQWILDDAGWRVLDPAANEMRTEWKDATPAAARPSTRPTSTTRPTASTGPTVEHLGPVLLIDPDGNRYYDGRAALAVVMPTGVVHTWPLPASAAQPADDMDAPVRLIRTPDGLLFLFNSPGQVARLRSTPETAGADEPFELDAVFTNGIPDSTQLQRIWLDPAGRIDVASDGNHLAIIFPTGQIPPDLSKWVLPQDLRTSGEQ